MYNIKVNILAIDYGTKFLGTALGNLELKIPRAHKTILNKSKKDVIEKVKEIIIKENVKLVILGIPEVKNPEKSWIFIKILEFALSLKRELMKIKKEGRFYPTELGIIVVDILIQYFQDLMDVKYTAKMENELDKIEKGKSNKLKILKGFHKNLINELENAYTNMQNIKKEGIKTDIPCPNCQQKVVQKWGKFGPYYECTNNECKKKFNSSKTNNITQESNELCPKCGSKMLIKKSKYGEFLACSDYPNCKTTKSIADKKDYGICPQCNSKLIMKRGKYGSFIACSNYPECTYKLSKQKIKCPSENCNGYLIRRKSKKGKFFYGCSNYPNCNYITWTKPKTNIN